MPVDLGVGAWAMGQGNMAYRRALKAMVLGRYFETRTPYAVSHQTWRKIIKNVQALPMLAGARYSKIGLGVGVHIGYDQLSS